MTTLASHFEVPLPCGRRLLIDPDGFDKIKHLSWQAYKHRTQEKYYVHHCFSERRVDGSWQSTHLLLARFLMDLDQGDPRVADHINGNPLDNRWVNLRICTGPQNVCNRGMSRHNTSGFKGVSKTKNDRWVSQIAFGGKSYYLGTFATPEEAHQAYCDAAVRLHGEFANFGEDFPPPGSGIEVLLPSSIGFLRQHLPDPVRHIPVKVGVEGTSCVDGLDATWSEHRSIFINGLLDDDKLIHDRVLRRFRDLVANGVVSEEDLPAVATMLVAAEVGYDMARTMKASRQKQPVVMQVFKNMLAAGLWREWESGQGVRWGFENGWAPEDEQDRRRFGAELALHVGVARVGVSEALKEWSLGIRMARAMMMEAARQARLARPEKQPYLRPPSRLQAVQAGSAVESFTPRRSKLRVVAI